MLITSIDEVRQQLEEADTVFFDVETSNLNPYKNGKILAGIAIKTKGHEPFYLPVRHFSMEENAELSEVRKLCSILQNKNLVLHNAKFDLSVMLIEGYDLVKDNIIYDTMVLARLIYEDLMSYELKKLGVKFVSEDAANNEKVLKEYMRKNKCETYAHVPPSVMEPYACNDVVLTEKLFYMFMRDVKARDLHEVLELELATTKALFSMEVSGTKIDLEYSRHQAAILKDKIDRLEKEAYEIAGQKFNLNATADVGRVFRELGVSSGKLTPTGKEKWAKDVLDDINHPLAGIILEYRKYYKLNNTYYSGFLELCDSDGILHPNFYQSGAKTGRLSCREPNLQNIPKQLGDKVLIKEGNEDVIDEEDAGKVRRAFVPRDGYFFLFTDWAQVEPRVFANYAKEQDLIKAFALGLDIHLLTAVTAYGKMPEDKNSEHYKWLRSMGKTVGLAILYGVGNSKLSMQIKRSPEEAGKFKRAYFSRFKKANALMNNVQKVIIDRGYLKNRWGRRRYLDPKFSYVGVNFIVQSSSADMMKDAIVRVNNALLPYKSRVLLTIHDELISEIAYDEYKEVIPIILNIMRKNEKINIPFRVDPVWSPISWADKISLECEKCAGSGVLTSVAKDELISMLLKSSFSSLHNIESWPCDVCGGEGYLFDVIDNYVKERGIL